MRTKQFKNNLEVSVLGVGTWSMGGSNSYGVSYGNNDDDISIKTIRTLIDNGVNLVDTAPVYGTDGASEKVVGQALKDGYREKVLLVTKFGNHINPVTGKREINNSYEAIVSEIEESLQRLQTDYIDIYLMHYPDPNTDISETMRALNDLKAQGKIKYAGLSNPTKSDIIEALKYGEVDAIQLPYSMVNTEKEDLLKWCHEKGMMTMAYGSLGAGILSGVYRELPNFGEKDVRNTFYPYFKEPMFSKIQKLLKDMDVEADKYNVPVSHVALNWVTQKKYITVSLVGVLNEEQALENCRAFSMNLSEDDVKFLDESIKINLE